MANDVSIRRYLALGGLLLELVVCPTLPGQATKSPSAISVPSEVTSWFKSAAIPLDSTSPESGLGDLRRMESTIGDARIVAMGEETHGTREFFQLKHRMLEFLVEKKGFTVFGMEANWPESLAINDYVLNGTGDAEEALDSFHFWTWNTEEVLNMIRWMRKYNQDPKHTNKVKFLGFDMQVAYVAVRNAERYLEKVDPGEAKVASRVLAPLSDAERERESAGRSRYFWQRTEQRIESLLAWLEHRKKVYVEASSLEEWTLARHNLEIVSSQCPLFQRGCLHVYFLPVLKPRQQGFNPLLGSLPEVPRSSCRFAFPLSVTQGSKYPRGHFGFSGVNLFQVPLCISHCHVRHLHVEPQKLYLVRVLRILVVLAHPADHVQHFFRVPSPEMETVKRLLSITGTVQHIIVDRQGFRPVRLHSENREAFFFDEKLQHAVLQLEEFPSAMRLLSHGDDARIPNG